MSQDASALVTRYQLGPILREYRTRSFPQLVGRAWLGILSCLVLGGLSLGGMFAIVQLGVFLVTGAWERVREEWLEWLSIELILGGSALLIAFLLLLLLILMALIIKGRIHSWRIYVCTEGLLVKKGRVNAFRWEQIDALWQKPAEHDLLRHGILVLWQRPDTCDVHIRGAGGRQVVLEPHLWSHFGELFAFLDRQISARLLPRALNALNAGEALDFGDLQVNQNGVSLLRPELGGKASATVPWSDIGDLKIKIRRSRLGLSTFVDEPLASRPTDHYCVVIEKRDQTCIRWDVPTVTNVSVLLAIKETQLGKPPGQAAP
ncbi:hypothetical protein KTAU_08530 [Thermogemmatispora aurantia]|uniref:Uncharacterized protein n=1 Tax=Thermogemmatispora aurantia TaxID=2045279 RepID=A0A5J4K3R6_9CHLR|nr:DUF6585 family protein [Thermogemmatispora aurantia]GER82215.1 hypothetical protein KTAU_08530 [Thermogemmatispora aurantia]